MNEFNFDSRPPIETGKMISKEKPQSELLGVMAQHFRTLAEGLTEIKGNDYLNQKPQKLIAEGVRIAKEYVSSGAQTPESALVKRFINNSTRTIREYFKSRHLDPKILTRSPVEAIVEMFSLDPQTARNILETLGIRIKSPAFALAGVNSFAQKAIPAEIMAGLLLMAEDKKTQDRSKSSAPPPPRQTQDFVPSAVKTGTHKVGEGTGKAAKVVSIGGGIILVLGICAFLGYGVIYYTDTGGARSAVATAAYTRTPTVIATPPPTVPPETAVYTTNKSIADKKYQEYQDTTSPAAWDPLDINSPPTQSLLSFFGEYWWYIKNELLRGYMDKVFAKDLTPEQITRIKQNKEDFFAVLEEAKVQAEKEGKKTKADKLQKAIDWYKQRKDFGNGKPEDFLKKLQSSSYFLPQQDLLTAQVLYQKLENVSDLLAHGIYSGRKGSFARTGLPKSEILRRQKLT